MFFCILYQLPRYLITDIGAILSRARVCDKVKRQLPLGDVIAGRVVRRYAPADIALVQHDVARQLLELLALPAARVLQEGADARVPEPRREPPGLARGGELLVPGAGDLLAVVVPAVGVDAVLDDLPELARGVVGEVVAVAAAPAVDAQGGRRGGGDGGVEGRLGEGTPGEEAEEPVLEDRAGPYGTSTLYSIATAVAMATVQYKCFRVLP